jgi:catechol 2,3-dioxygenase-like lactoylglutathione lyase family enzyme
MADAAKFYEKTLGLKPTMRKDGMIGFETGSFELFVEKGSPAHGPVFDFLVADLEAARKMLIAAGCTVEEDNASVPRLYMRDPFGLVFNVAKR